MSRSRVFTHSRAVPGFHPALDGLLGGELGHALSADPFQGRRDPGPGPPSRSREKAISFTVSTQKEAWTNALPALAKHVPEDCRECQQERGPQLVNDAHKLANEGGPQLEPFLDHLILRHAS